MIKNGSGAVRRKIGDALGDTVTESQKSELATIIYYPHEKLQMINRVGGLGDEEYKDIIIITSFCFFICLNFYSIDN